MKRKADTLLAVIFVSVLALMISIGCQQTDVEQAAAVNETEPKNASTTTEAVEAESTPPQESSAEARVGNSNVVASSGEAEARVGNGKVRAGDVVVGDGTVRAGAVVVGDGGAGDDNVRPGRVRLKIGGEPGARFSGTCTLGDEEREVSGQVPGRFVFEPEGREVECELRNGGPDAGPLEFSVTVGGENRKQRINVTGDTMSFTLSENGISHTTSSASGAASQRSTITNSSSSSSSVSSSSGSR